MNKKEITVELLKALNDLLEKVNDVEALIDAAPKKIKNENEEIDLDQLLCDIQGHFYEAQERIESCISIAEIEIEYN